MNRNIFDVSKYLSDKERTLLNNLNNTSNNISNINIEKEDFINKSLKSIFEEWSNKMNAIIKDLIYFIHNVKTYYVYFKDIDETKNWWNGVVRFIGDLITIFTKKGRTIYVGLSFLILSLLTYIIQITS